MTLENLQFIVSIITLLGFVFVVYRTFHEPDVKADKSITILDRELTEQKKLANEALIITQNCIHSLELKTEVQIKQLNILTNRIIKLETIIEERLPRKV